MDGITPTAHTRDHLTVSFQTILVGAVLTIVTLGLLGWNGWSAIQNYASVVSNQKQFEEQVAAIAHVDEMMTMAVRLGASTGDSVWTQRYDLLVGQREAAVSEAIKYIPGAFAQTIMQTYGTGASRLMRDRLALKLVADGDRDGATNVVFSEDYENQQQLYRRDVMQGQMKLREAITTLVSAARLRAYLVGVFTAVTLVAAVLAWVGALKMMNRQITDRRRAAVELRRAHDQLEQRVVERTANLAEANQRLQEEIVQRHAAQAERERIHDQLVESSRKLGMAEVATNVLHNVGNVLNSVNVSADVIRQQLDKSGSGDIIRVASLLREHEHDLVQYITEDQRGKHLPRFLIELAQQIEHEQAAVSSELETLARNIDHIKTIVAMQQSHARVGSNVETVCVAELIRDALTMTDASLSRHGVSVTQDVDPAIKIVVDRHKVLQILVNLLSNAKSALCEAGNSNRTLHIAIARQTDPAALILEITDNGVGIAPENLTRIFAHGFTTRDDGHGFGLHSCALAATEMQGSLTAHSDGLGCGATFRLELPVDQPEHAEVAA